MDYFTSSPCIYNYCVYKFNLGQKYFLHVNYFYVIYCSFPLYAMQIVSVIILFVFVIYTINKVKQNFFKSSSQLVFPISQHLHIIYIIYRYYIFNSFLVDYLNIVIETHFFYKRLNFIFLYCL